MVSFETLGKRAKLEPAAPQHNASNKNFKKEAATLGRTTDLRMIAETAIPRSTTELQQLVENEFKFL